MAEYKLANGRTVEVSDFQLAQNPKLAEGLTPVTTSGASQQILTGVETGAATVANLGSAASRFAGDVDTMGNPINTVDPVAPEALVPGAFTPAALERRESNPGAALAGSIAVEAPTLLIPGGAEGWVGRLGLGLARGAASGAIAEAGQSAIGGEQFSAKDAAFYGLVGESLGALANGAIGRFMRATGKEAPSALEVAARRASKADVADALGETAGAMKATKMADNAVELTDKAVTDLGESLGEVNAKLDRAEAAAFTPAAIRRTVSNNAVAQADNLLTRGVELESAARQLVTEGVSAEHSAFAGRVQEAVDELLSKRSSTDMYGTLRKVSTELAQDAPEGLPDYVTAALGRLDDSLVDEATWGNVAKLAGQSKTGQAARGAFSEAVFGEGQVNRAKLAELFGDGADRNAFHAYLDSAEAAAKGSADKGLRRAVEAARASVAAGDDATMSSLLRNTFAERATKAITHKVVGGALRYGLGALGLHGGIAGGIAGAALGDAVAPAVSSFVAPAVRSAVDAAAPFVEQAAARFNAEGVAPVLRRLAQSASTQVQTAGRAMSNSALRASQSTIGKLGAPTMSAGVASFMSGHDNLRSAFAEKREVLDLVQRDPVALVGELDDSLGGLSASHPELHAEIAAKHYQALNYVRTKIPETIGVSLSSPSGIPPSSLAIRTFALYYSGATDPSSVIEDVRNNRVRQEQLEALRTVWPEVYQDLKTATLQGMAESKPTVQQRMRMDLLFDFGPALDAGLSWSLALVMDGQRAQAAQSQGKPGSMPRGRSTPSTQAQQPQGLAALANPQVR